MKRLLVGVALGITLALPFSAGASPTASPLAELHHRMNALCRLVDARTDRHSFSVACPNLIPDDNQPRP